MARRSIREAFESPVGKVRFEQRRGQQELTFAKGCLLADARSTVVANSIGKDGSKPRQLFGAEGPSVVGPVNRLERALQYIVGQWSARSKAWISMGRIQTVAATLALVCRGFDNPLAVGCPAAIRKVC